MGEAAFVIVGGVDYSELSDAALERAFALAAREPQVDIHVINVLSPLELAQPNLPKGALLEVEIAASQLQRYVASRLSAFSQTQCAN